MKSPQTVEHATNNAKVMGLIPRESKNWLKNVYFEWNVKCK